MYANFYGTHALNPQNLPSIVSEIQNSGFNSVTLGLFHVGRDIHNKITNQNFGDIVYGNDVVITQNKRGKSVFKNGFGEEWRESIIALRDSGSVEKIYFSFGGGSPVVDFTTIKTKIMVNGEIPSDSKFYQNFMALGEMYADVVDGIDIDNEDAIEADVNFAFGKLALDAGFKEVTFCPPFDGAIQTWVDSAEKLDQYRPGAVTLFNLQAYGSAVPSMSWVKAIAAANLSRPPYITGGLNAQNSDPSAVCKTINGWVPLPGFIGGFIWDYHQMTQGPNAYEIADYANAIFNGMTGRCVSTTEPEPEEPTNNLGTFPVSYLIGGSALAAPLFNVKLIVNAAREAVVGSGNITQPTIPFLDIYTDLRGDYTEMTVMPKKSHILVTLTGYPNTNWPPHSGIGPVISANVKLRMVLSSDWKTGTATYSYKDKNGRWQTVTNAPVKVN